MKYVYIEKFAYGNEHNTTSRIYQIGAIRNDTPEIKGLWCDYRVCEGFWGDEDQVKSIVNILNSHAVQYSGTQIKKDIKMEKVKRMDTIEIDEIRVSANPGTNQGDAIRESIILASTEWRNVRLKFNDREYLIKPNKLIESVESISLKTQDNTTRI